MKVALSWTMQPRLEMKHFLSWSSNTEASFCRPELRFKIRGTWPYSAAFSLQLQRIIIFSLYSPFPLLNFIIIFLNFKWASQRMRVLLFSWSYGISHLILSPGLKNHQSTRHSITKHRKNVNESAKNIINYFTVLISTV